MTSIAMHICSSGRGHAPASAVSSPGTFIPSFPQGVNRNFPAFILQGGTYQSTFQGRLTWN